MGAKNLIRQVLSKGVRPHGYEFVPREVLYD